MRKIYFILVAAVFIVYGCATPRITDVPETMALKEPPAIAAPEQISEPSKAEESPLVKEKGLFSLSIRNEDIRSVLFLLSKDSGVNIIADKDVAGLISIDFSALDLSSALYAITKPLGYTFRMEKGFIRVSKPVLEARSFKINYITGKRESTSIMNAAISAGGTTGGVTGGTNINISSGATSSGTQAAASYTQGNVNVTTSGTSDFWKEMRKGLEVIIFGDLKNGSETEGGYSRGDEKTGKKLIISELAGIVYVADYSDNMERVENFLNEVQKAVSKQVMIQAHIVEVALSDGYKFGIDWDAVAGSSIITMGETVTFSQGLVVDPATKVFQINIKSDRVNALLDAMREQGQVNVLSSPKISTLNNQKAVIKLTTKEVSWVTSTYITQGVAITNTSPQVDEVGLFLDVTPQIDDEGMITMQIHPSISEKIKDSLSPDKEHPASKPVIDTREVDTMIKVKNGQTIVIAGLITDKISDAVKRVPLLGDLPVLGALFRQVVQEKKKSELVILLTPYILNDKSIEEIRSAHEERLKKAGRPFESVPVLGKERQAIR